MIDLMADVAAFHKACSVPVLLSPQVPSEDRQRLRFELIDEEVNRELIPAIRDGNLPAIADAMADAIYVIVGAALEYGIPLGAVWQAVQASNMAKVDPVTGMVRKRADGKVLKPEGWKPPDIAGILSDATP